MSDNQKRTSSHSRRKPQGTGRTLYTHRNRPVHIPDGYMAVGYITSVHGLRGEIKIEPHSDIPDRFADGVHLWLGEELQKVTIEQARTHQNQLLVKLEGIDDRDTAEELRGLWLFIPEAEAGSLPEDTYWVHDIIGLQVITTEGQSLGVIRDVLFTAANEVYIIEPAPGINKNRELLIPAIADVVQQIDLDARTMTIYLLPGLLDV